MPDHETNKNHIWLRRIRIAQHAPSSSSRQSESVRPKPLAAWQELPLAWISYLETLLHKEQIRGRSGERKALLEGAETSLREAREACTTPRWRRILRYFRAKSGYQERIWSHIRVADTNMLALASDADLRARVSEVGAMVHHHISKQSPQRKAFDAAEKRIGQSEGPVARQDRQVLVNALGISYSSLDGKYRRVRVMANLLWLLTAAAVLGLVGLAFWGRFDKQTLDLCFLPDPPGTKVVCPSGEKFIPPGGAPPAVSMTDPENVIVGEQADNWDVLTVEATGLIGAAFTVVASVHRMHDSHSTPYRLPMAAAVLKFPMGGLSALAGLLLIKAAFIPGLSNLDSSSQILGWAIIFGASQHLVTHLVDRRAEETIASVRQPPHPPAGSGQQAA